MLFPAAKKFSYLANSQKLQRCFVLSQPLPPCHPAWLLAKIYSLQHTPQPRNASTSFFSLLLYLLLCCLLLRFGIEWRGNVIQRIGVLVEDRELIFVMRPDDVHNYLAQRRLQLVGPRVVDLAHALHIKPQQATAMLTGRSPVGHKMIERINEIDDEYELVALVGVVRKTKPKTTDIGLPD